jgi:putative transposase
MDAFFVTLRTYGDKVLLQNDRYAALLAKCIFHYRDHGQFAVHAFAILPDHAHIVLTPIVAESVERCVQLIKGSFSHLVREKIGYPGEVWRLGFHAQRLIKEETFRAAIEYTHESPVRRGHCTDTGEYRFSSASPLWKVDAAPHWQKPEVAEELSRA